MSVSPDDRLREIARRVKWFDAPEHTLAYEKDFLCRVMAFATFEDAAVVEHTYGRERMTAALRSAAPGVIDARSWAYWHLRLGLGRAGAMPRRQFA
jgi:hypothetical protein